MENNHKYKLTQSGIDKLKDELEHLKTTRRDENLQALKEARAQGDLSENADYDAAREEQAQIEKRIKELENILKHAELIVEDSSSKINIGKRVWLEVNNTPAREYNLVGTLEADPLNHKISNESPVGKAIIGKKKGDTVTFKTEHHKEIKVHIVDVK